MTEFRQLELDFEAAIDPITGVFFDSNAIGDF